MNRVPEGRYASELDGDFVVFLIGMRIRRPWRLRSWLSVSRGMARMLQALDADPESGLLGWERALIRGPAVVQYWRSFEHLERYARDRDAAHWPAWVAYNKKVGAASGDVGIWHETYRIGAGQYEAIYGAMPAFGLGRVGRLVPAAGARESARGRMAPTAASNA
jgi:hypothetical protein